MLKNTASFPLLIKRKGIAIARAVVKVLEDGSFRYTGNLNIGDIIQFGFGNTEAILNDPIIPHTKDYSNTENFFIYSCMARRRCISDLMHKENTEYSNIANTSGFFTYGEYEHLG